MGDVEFGVRKAILNDLSPMATFLSSVYNSKINKIEFNTKLNDILDRIREKYGCEIVPINPKSITEIMVDSGMKYFCYYPDMKIAILPPQPTEGLPTDFGLAIVNEIVKLMKGSNKASCRSALDYVRKLPIIAVTANAFAEDVQASRQAGMNEHIAKPLDFTRLHELLVKYLG